MGYLHFDLDEPSIAMAPSLTVLDADVKDDWDISSDEDQKIEEMRREEERKAVEKSDAQNVLDLFGEAQEQKKIEKIPIAKKKENQDLKQKIMSLLLGIEKTKNYENFLSDLTKSLYDQRPTEEIRRIIQALSTMELQKRQKEKKKKKTIFVESDQFNQDDYDY